jgi:hypothetical protein
VTLPFLIENEPADELRGGGHRERQGVPRDSMRTALPSHPGLLVQSNATQAANTVLVLIALHASLALAIRCNAFLRADYYLFCSIQSDLSVEHILEECARLGAVGLRVTLHAFDVFEDLFGAQLHHRFRRFRGRWFLCVTC